MARLNTWQCDISEKIFVCSLIGIDIWSTKKTQNSKQCHENTERSNRSISQGLSWSYDEIGISTSSAMAYAQSKINKAAL
jgi:hypothetical protein